MPGKRREVHAFVTRLNPLLVRKLDAYAVQSNLSRNQAIEKLLERSFELTHEVRALREAERAMTEHQAAEMSSTCQSEQIESYLQEREESSEYQRIVASERLAKEDFFDEKRMEHEIKPKSKRKGK